MAWKRITLLCMGLLVGMGALAAEPAVAVKSAPIPVDGMLCITETKEIQEPLLVPVRMPAGGGGGGHVPSCPTNFSNCPDVPGRNCSLQNCVTEDLGYSSCRRPGGIIISCTSGNLQQTTCDCEEQFHQICCDDNSCGFACGTCSGGSLSTVCPPG